MQSDILRKIDVLVEMAGASLSIDTLKAELNEIEKESDKLKNELSILTSSNLDEKYFKATEKQVDENIKVSLEAKIKKQEKYLKSLQEQIYSVTLEESELHSTIIILKDEISSSKDYITALNDRIPTIIDGISLGNYKNILNEEEKHINELISLLRKKEEEYAEVLERLNYLNLAKEELQTKLDSNKERLQETKSSLINPLSYVDDELKRLDLDRIEEIKKELLVLDKRRIEIITDPTIIAEEAKELILDDDRTSALAKVRELVTLVKSKPYMDIPSSSEMSSMLVEELEIASNKRDDFAALIDTKEYSGVDTTIVTARIDYLNSEISNIENKIQALKDEVKSIDENDFAILNERLEEAVRLSNELEQDIQEYEEIMESDEEKTPKRRAVLNAAFLKKQKDLETIHMVIENYKKDQKELIKQAHEFEAVEIPAFQKVIDRLKDEIKLLNKVLLTSTKSKDVLAIENDKKKLKELDDTVKAIKHRQKYEETPSEIFDEIEIYLGTIEEEPEVLDFQPESTGENSVLDHDYENLALDEPKELDLNEETVLDEVIKEIATDLSLEFEPFDTTEIMNELPELPDEEATSERLKVVAIEPVEEIVKTEEEDNPFIIADYKDDDYIDVDTLFNDEGVL